MNKLGQQGDAAIGEILRTAAEQAPCCALDGAQGEFVGKEGILAHQLLVITLTAVGTVEQPGLPEEQRLDLQDGVAVLVQQAQRRDPCQAFKGLVVDAKT